MENDNRREEEKKKISENENNIDPKDKKGDDKPKEKKESNSEKNEEKVDMSDLESHLKQMREIRDKLKDGFGFESGDRRPDGKKGKKSDGNFGGGFKGGKSILVWIGIIVIGLIIMNYMDKQSPVIELNSINEFYKHIDNVEKIEITNSGAAADIKGSFRQPVSFTRNGTPSTYEDFTLTSAFVDYEQVEKWVEQGMDVKFVKESYGVTNFLLNMIPWILIIALWIYLMRRMQGGGSGSSNGRGIFNFGKSRARMMTDDRNTVTFKDVAGVTEAKEELTEVIDYLKNPEKYIEIGARIPRGVLLLGSPGTGKTLLAKAVAGEAGVPFFSMSGADFVEMFVGVGASRVRDLFEQGKKSSPCIIFIDELDAVGRHRGTGIGGGNDEREQTLNQLLVEMDGFDTDDSVIIIAATNRPDVLDPALLRPGRFDRQIMVDRPDVKAREEILKVHAGKVKLEVDVNLEIVAKGTPGMSGADLANIINEAALFAARRKKKTISMLDVEDAKDKVMMGVERRSAVINEKEREMTAYHEAGHVLVAKFTEGSDPVHKVTIIPRGRAMGITHYLPIEERHSYSKKYITGKLLHLLGGRVAEELIFGDVTTGASDDIERATDLARKMVCEWGMSDEIGPIHYGVKGEDPFLGKQLTRTSTVSEAIGSKIDEAVQKMIFKALNETRLILEENIDKLHTLSKELIKKETLTGLEIDEIIGVDSDDNDNENTKDNVVPEPA